MGDEEKNLICQHTLSLHSNLIKITSSPPFTVGQGLAGAAAQNPPFSSQTHTLSSSHSLTNFPTSYYTRKRLPLHVLTPPKTQ